MSSFRSGMTSCSSSGLTSCTRAQLFKIFHVKTNQKVSFFLVVLKEIQQTITFMPPGQCIRINDISFPFPNGVVVWMPLHFINGKGHWIGHWCWRGNGKGLFRWNYGCINGGEANCGRMPVKWWRKAKSVGISRSVTLYTFPRWIWLQWARSTHLNIKESRPIEHVAKG